MRRKEEFALSKRELDVMNVLWAEDEPMIASKIPEKRPGLSINTVQSVLKKLLQRGFVEVAQIVQSGTVLSRSYSPAITPEEYAIAYIKTEICPFSRPISKAGVLNALFDGEENDEELIKELEEFIQEKKSK